MKKFCAIIFSCFVILCSAQCNIIGNDTLQIGERRNYTIEVNPENAGFQWGHNGQKVIFESATTIPTVVIKGAVVGEALLELKVNTSTSEFSCKKLVNVIIPRDREILPQPAGCAINIEGIKEIKTNADTVRFEAIRAETTGKYLWTVHYRNGQTKVSTEKSPTFSYTFEQVISAVDLQITSDVCVKKMTKNYHDNYWYFF